LLHARDAAEAGRADLHPVAVPQPRGPLDAPPVDEGAVAAPEVFEGVAVALAADARVASRDALVGDADVAIEPPAEQALARVEAVQGPWIDARTRRMQRLVRGPQDRRDRTDRRRAELARDGARTARIRERAGGGIGHAAR